MNFSEIRKYSGIILFLALLTLGIYLEGGKRVLILSLALCTMLLQKNENAALCFFAQTFMCDSLEIITSLSFSSIAAMVFLTKVYLLDKETKVNKTFFVIISLIIILQFCTTILFNNSLINVIRFAVNLFIFMYFVNFSKKFKSNSVLIPSIVSISVLLACYVGMHRALQVDDLGVVRFSGIWIDDNFCGMYCILGIISSVYSIINSRYTLIFAVPSILLALYMGMLSMSRTFIVVLIILAFVSILYIFYNKSIRKFYKFFVLILLLIGVVYFINQIALVIFEARAGAYNSIDSDITNGRFSLSMDSLYAWINTPLAWVIGIGCSNSPIFKSSLGLESMASHNTYVDILVECGLVVFIYIFYIVCRFLKKFTNQLRHSLAYTVLFSFVVLCYMGTLTMGQYSLLYIVLGMVIDYINTPNNRAVKINRCLHE